MRKEGGRERCMRWRGGEREEVKWNKRREEENGEEEEKKKNRE